MVHFGDVQVCRFAVYDKAALIIGDIRSRRGLFVDHVSGLTPSGAYENKRAESNRSQ